MLPGAISGLLGFLLVRPAIYVPGNPTATAANLVDLGAHAQGAWLDPHGGGCGYLLSALLSYGAAIPTWLAQGLTLPASIGEFWMIGYLLSKGIRPATYATAAVRAVVALVDALARVRRIRLLRLLCHEVIALPRGTLQRKRMDPRFDPEAIDLASVRNALELRCGPFVEGDVVGRTRLRDEVARHTGCSLLDAERIVDTMIARGFLRKERMPDGRTGWNTEAVH